MAGLLRRSGRFAPACSRISRAISPVSVARVSAGRSGQAGVCRYGPAGDRRRTGRSAGAAPADCSPVLDRWRSFCSLAWASPRFWSREVRDAPESAAHSMKRMRLFSACRRSSATPHSAARLTKGAAAEAAHPDRPPDRTSRPESPASGPRQNRSACSGKQRRRLARSPHERRLEAPNHGCQGYRTLGTSSRGRSQVLLYNTVRPHSSIGWLTPDPYAVQYPG